MDVVERRLGDTAMGVDGYHRGGHCCDFIRGSWRAKSAWVEQISQGDGVVVGRGMIG